MKKQILWCLLCILPLVACSDEPDQEPEIFRPGLTFIEPEPSYEPEIHTEEEGGMELLESKVQIIPEYATASSIMPDTPSESFHPSNTFDGSENTAWVEDSPGYGLGEWLRHHFLWEEEVQEVWIYNGHGDFSRKYASISEISLRFSDGTEGMYALEPGWNSIILPQAVVTTYVELMILSADTALGENSCIGEMRLFSASSQTATEQLGMETVLKNMGALGDCSNITPQQAQAFAQELQYVMDWAETTKAERIHKGEAYGEYTGEALLFAGGDGIPVLYYDYDFKVVEDLFVTETDVVVWDGEKAQRSFFETAGSETSINWILPGYVYENRGEYYFGLTEYDLYGSGTFGLIACVGFDKGIPQDTASYLGFICHKSRGAYTYGAELADYGKMSYLSRFPLAELELLVGEGEETYFEFYGSHFQEKDLGVSPTNTDAWLQAIRQARVDAGYEHVTQVQPGDVVLAGLQTLATGVFHQENTQLAPGDLDPDYFDPEYNATNGPLPVG